MLLSFSYDAKAQLPNCAGYDSTLIFIHSGSNIMAYDPSLPLSAANPWVFLTSTISLAGLTISNNLNGGAASPTFYTNSGGNYWYYNGAGWTNTGHAVPTVNPGGGMNYIFSKNGGTGSVNRYDGTGAATFLVNVTINAGPYDLSVDQNDNFYHLETFTSPGKLKKYNSSGVLIDSFTVTGNPISGAGGGFAMLGNMVYGVFGGSPSFYGGPIIGSAVNMSPIGSLSASDVATCPSKSVSSGPVIIPPPVANFNISNDSICEGTCITFTDATTNAPTGWQWNFGNGTPSTSLLQNPGLICFNTPGVNTITLIASNSGGADTVTKTVWVFAKPVASVSGDSLLCEGDSTVLTAAPGGLAYQWLNDGSLQEVHPVYPTTTTVYTVVVTQAICSDTVSYPVQVDPKFNAFIQGDSIVCRGKNAVLSALPLGATSYVWNTTATTQNINITPTTDTALWVFIHQGECTDSGYHFIKILDPNYGSFTILDDHLCVGQPAYFTDSIVNASAFQYDFGDGSTVDNKHHPVHTYSVPGNPHTVTLTTDNPVCGTTTFSLPIVVDEYPSVNLGEDQKFCEGLTAPIVLSNLANPSGLYLWSTGETSNSIVVNQAGRYWLKASNGDCETTDSIWIKRDCYLNIPNSFSPNGDGRNDYFLPREILSSGVRSFKMEIYNRWGEQIFSTTTTDGRGWDGKYNGVDQPVGVFVYLIDVEFINGVKKNFTGNVTLMR